MQLTIHDSKAKLGEAAAAEGAEAIAAAIGRKGAANIVLATGASQFEMLAALTRLDLDWSRVTAFHLDEYVGISADHPASFRRYLRERVLDRLPRLKEFVMIAGDAADLEAEIARLNTRIGPAPIDVCFAGIGENCHLAFNDPPADFAVEAPYIVVDLDEACRRQQMGEGWFAVLDDVPRQAVSMSIRQIMRSDRLVISVSDMRKARAVHDALEEPVTPLHPASIIRTHPHVALHLDGPAASQLQAKESSSSAG